jgi:hypothetical protein
MKSIEALTERDRAGYSRVGSRRPSRWLQPALAASLAAMAIGCGSGKSTVIVDSPANPSQLYFAPGMDSGSQGTYAIDHTAKTFVRSTYNTSGATITQAGAISTLTSGVISMGATYINGNGNGNVILPNPVIGSWAVELPGQAALVELDIPAETTSQEITIPAVNYFNPAVPTQSCPSLATAETFQFVTIPENLLSTSSANKISAGSWNPGMETAYGSVQIATSGSSVEFSSVSQHTLPVGSSGTPGTPSFPAPASATAECDSTYYGQVVSFPSTSTVNSNGIASPTATIGIGPSGFLVEDAGTGAADPVTGLQYENLLGAGYGAVGLPQPANDITSALISAQYQGFLYSPGPSSHAFSLISSFGGYSNQQTSCATLLAEFTAAQLQPSINTVYGGEFAGNNPSSSPIGNCDIAIDLGTQSSNSNGLYTKATIYVGAAFPPNGTGKIYSFPAVAIAGQLKSNNAIFLIGADTTGSSSRAWGIYLLQSN